MIENNMIDSAAGLWRRLKAHAALDVSFYDKDLLLGDDTMPGLYEHLHITPVHPAFEQDLEHYAITVEKLVVALLATLQPYAQMMKDICSFFEKHLITETNQSLKIAFDFDSVKDNPLTFDLEHFKQSLEHFKRVQQWVSRYRLDVSALWAMAKLLHDNYHGRPEVPDVVTWIHAYREEWLFPVPAITLPTVQTPGLEKQLRRVIGVWESFINACRAIHVQRNRFRDILDKALPDPDSDSRVYDPQTLKSADSDHWGATLLECLYGRLQEIAALDPDDRIREEQVLAQQLAFFFEQQPEVLDEEEHLLRVLTDVLNLPVWKKRYELYAAWILALTDRAVENYPRTYRHQDGVLTLRFAATHLATIRSCEGELNLWAEVRSPVDNPEGKSRTQNIQPDYAIYKGSDTGAENCIAAIEVKQYRKPGVANFTAALNDYTKGLPMAHVFLANYGLVPSRMALAAAERAHAFGQVRPLTAEADQFVDAVRAVLPLPELPALPSSFTVYDQALLWGLPIDWLYIDISSSLNDDNYKVFLNKIITSLVKHGQVLYMAAVDIGIKREWSTPSEQDVQELLQLQFEDLTVFAHLVKTEGHVVVITDDDGLASLKWEGVNAYVIHYVSAQQQEFLFIGDAPWSS